MSLYRIIKKINSLILGLLLIASTELKSQGCCSGGSGSPIAGGSSQGVLQNRQLELASNFQYTQSNRFFAKDKDTVALFDKLSSKYLYFRLAYGITERLTMSVETGYFLDKTQIGLHKKDTITSSGIADLILFPRYNVYNNCGEKRLTELTLGMGYKIPLGKYNDSNVVYKDPTTGKKYYTTSPPNIQPTTGSNDFIFYGFFMQDYTNKKFKFFANALYIRKGWNPLGQKFGDYASVGLFISKSFFKKRLGLTLQAKGELVGKLKADRNVDMIALYNVYPSSTGSRKIFVVPQLNFTYKTFTIYAFSEIPVYQYLHGTQVGSDFHINAGMAYRFVIRKKQIVVK